MAKKWHRYYVEGITDDGRVQCGTYTRKQFVMESILDARLRGLTAIVAYACDKATFNSGGQFGWDSPTLNQTWHRIW